MERIWIPSYPGIIAARLVCPSLQDTHSAISFLLLYLTPNLTAKAEREQVH